jgi:arylsulfatase A-like enzyme
MPHPPYYYDRYGTPTDNSVIYRQYKDDPTLSYLDYLLYTNEQIKEMINTIRTNSPNAIIILLSDHGYRKRFDKTVKEPPHFFENLNAIYYPDHNYSGLYDSITNVNLFRVVLNKTFNQHFPLEKDSTVFLAEKKSSPP